MKLAVCWLLIRLIGASRGAVRRRDQSFPPPRRSCSPDRARLGMRPDRVIAADHIQYFTTYSSLIVPTQPVNVNRFKLPRLKLIKEYLHVGLFLTILSLFFSLKALSKFTYPGDIESYNMNTEIANLRR